MPSPSPRTFQRPPQWLWLSLLTIVVWGLWGVQSKMAVARVSAWINQVLFTLGLIPLAVWAVRNRGDGTVSQRTGAAWGFCTGILGGVGNAAFYVALERGGQASVVVPLTCLFPVVTVMLALVTLREKIGRTQWAGVALAIAAAVLLGE
jgi:bacterial/archaeal transporter family protein